MVTQGGGGAAAAAAAAAGGAGNGAGSELGGAAGAHAGSSGGQHALRLLALDELVLECLQQRELGSSSPQGCARTSLRAAISAGDIPQALGIIRERLPVLLQDQRLVFRLYKQQFVELTRAAAADAHVASGGKAAALSCGGAAAAPAASAPRLDEAIECARTLLAPLALDAYPEAYNEFKHAMQLLVYGGVAQHERPGACQALLSAAARDELAEVVFQTSGQVLGAEEPRLTLLLTHLLRLHRQHRHLLPPRPPPPGGAAAAAPHPLAASPGKGLVPMHPPQHPQHGELSVGGVGGAGGGKPSEGVAELCSRLMLLGRDAPPLPPEQGYGPSVSSFNESDIMALMQCAGSSRHDAIAALRSSGNRLAAAFKAELRRFRLNEPLLRELLLEYAHARGLPVPAHAAHPQPWPASPGHTDGSHEGGSGAPGGGVQGEQQQQEEEAMVEAIEGVRLQEDTPTDLAGSAGGSAAPPPPPQPPQRWRAAERRAGAGEGGDAAGGSRWPAAPSSPSHVSRITLQRSASQSPPAKLPCCRSDAPTHPAPLPDAAALAWAPDGGASQGPPAATGDGHTTTSVRGGEGGGAGARGGGAAGKGGASATRRLKVADLVGVAQEGGAPELHDAVERMRPGFWAAQPLLLFELWACEFRRLLALPGGEGPVEALALARQRLTPLAQQHPALQPQLKGIMALLLPGLPGPEAAAGKAHGAAAAPTGRAPMDTDGGGAAGQGEGSAPAAVAADLAAVVAQVSGLLANSEVSDTRLVHVMQELLALHKAWLRAERAEDPFQDLLGLGMVKGSGAPGGGGAGQAQAQQPRGVGGGGGADEDVVMVTDEGDDGEPHHHAHAAHHGHAQHHHLVHEEDEEDEDGEQDEGPQGGGQGGGGGQGAHGVGLPSERDVGRLMEILNLPRSQALMLLLEYGDVASAVNSAFG